jgi:hypothetical protein
MSVFRTRVLCGLCRHTQDTTVLLRDVWEKLSRIGRPTYAFVQTTDEWR